MNLRASLHVICKYFFVGHKFCNFYELVQAYKNKNMTVHMWNLATVKPSFATVTVLGCSLFTASCLSCRTSPTKPTTLTCTCDSCEGNYDIPM